MNVRLRRALTAASMAVVLLAAAACSGDDESSADPDDADATRGAGTLTEAWPLTGLPVEGETPEHPVMVVKVPNTPEAEPQLGLGSADLVVQELVEGGLTRLAAFYYSEVPKMVGPIRSIRGTDVGIVAPSEGVLVASGGSGKVVNAVAKADIELIRESGDLPGYTRVDTRVSPYNLMMKLDDLAAALEPGDVPPPYLPFGEPDLGKAKRATAFSAVFSGAHTTEWDFKGGTYVRPGSHADPKSDFVADNVLVLRVEVGDAGYLDPAGNPVPESILKGKGQAMLFTDGKVLTGTWEKDNMSSELTLEAKGGGQMSVPPGKTWIELLPKQGGSVRITG